MAEIGIELITEMNMALLDSADKGVFDAPVRADFVENCLANPNQFLIVATVQEKVIGKVLSYVFFFPDKPTEIYIEEIDVAKEWRRQDVASRLMDAVGAEGRKRGIAEYWLVAERSNKGARALYKSKAHFSQKSVWYEFYC